MAIETPLERDARQTATLERLLSERGLGPHARFFEVAEGRFMDDGLEEMSGFVLAADGQAYRFELGWDKADRRATLTELRPVQPQPEWDRVGEYRRARQMLGLGAD